MYVKMPKPLLICLAAAQLVALSGCWSATYQSKKLNVIALTDLHGALDIDVLNTADGKPLRTGGAALLSSYIQVVRNQSEIPTLVVDAGDLFQGSMISNSAEGRPVIDFYNYVGVDAVAIGNHDFDYGPEGQRTIPASPSDDPRGALKSRIAQAKFPFLACNIFEKATGKRPDWAVPSRLIQKGDVKVGVIGAATVLTPSTTVARNVMDLDFADPVAPILEQAKALRDQGADFIVLALHAGAGCSDNSVEHFNDMSSCGDGEIFDVLKRLPAGAVDAAVGGHTHKGIAKMFNGIAVVQAYSRAKRFGWLTLNQDPQTPANLHGLIEVCESVVNINGSPTCDSFALKTSHEVPFPAVFEGIPISEDAGAMALLKADFERVAETFAKPINVTATESFERSYYEENALGNMLSDAFNAAYPEMDIVLINNGGLRAELKAGNLRYGDIFNVLPFDNRMATITIDGATLLKLFEIGISRKDGGHSMSNVEFIADQCKILTAKVSGKEVDPGRTYKILTVDFLAMGGSGLSGLNLRMDQISIWEEQGLMRDIAVDALKSWRPTLTPKDYLDPAHPRQTVLRVCDPTAAK